MVIMVRSALDKLAESGAAGAGVADPATGRVAPAVKAGAPEPDIGTVEAFKQALLNARSFCHPVAKAPNPDGARDLIRFLFPPAAYDATRASGMNPAREKK